MKEKVLLVTGVLAALSAACGSKASMRISRDGAADVAQGTGDALGPDAPFGSGGSSSSGSGGVIGQGGSGPMGSGGVATGSGGVGGKTGTGGIGGAGGQSLDAAIAVDAITLDVGSQLDGASAYDATIDLVAPNCAAMGGACTQWVNGCATCPSGRAPAASRIDCPSQSWCCVPLPAVTDECWKTGGMCLNGLNSLCPAGWMDDWTSCRNATAKCCMPNPDVCNTGPKDVH